MCTLYTVGMTAKTKHTGYSIIATTQYTHPPTQAMRQAKTELLTHAHVIYTVGMTVKTKHTDYRLPHNIHTCL